MAVTHDNGKENPLDVLILFEACAQSSHINLIEQEKYIIEIMLYINFELFKTEHVRFSRLKTVKF